MVQLIKKISREEREAGRPSDFLIGTVSSVSPLKIRLTQKITLTGDFFYITESLNKKEFLLGDKIAIVSSQGGQRYLLIDKVV